jgi:hypothetical protein
MGYAAAYKPDYEALDQFLRRKGGITSAPPGFLGAWGEGRRMALARCAHEIVSGDR